MPTAAKSNNPKSAAKKSQYQSKLSVCVSVISMDVVDRLLISERGSYELVALGHSAWSHCVFMSVKLSSYPSFVSLIRVATKSDRQNSRIIQGCFKDLFMIFKDVETLRKCGVVAPI